MTITRERQSDIAGRQACRCGDARFRQRPDERIRDFHREYGGSGGLIQGGDTPAFLLVFCLLYDMIRKRRVKKDEKEKAENHTW